MEQDFDFKDIGKRMPYRTPDGFFEKMQEQVIECTLNEKHRKTHRIRLLIVTSMAVAAMVLGWLFFPATTFELEQQPVHSLVVAAEPILPDTMDEMVANMADDELEEWTELSENDIFIN